MGKKTKAQLKAERAAALRAELGIDDDEPVHEARSTMQGRVQKVRDVQSPAPDVVPEPKVSRPAKASVVKEIDPKHWPRKHEHGSLKRGDSVWYRGERFYIEFAPSHWSKGCYARICDKPVRPVPHPSPSDNPDFHGLSFCVHPDTLDLAPVVKNVFAAQPTLAGQARRERAARGEKDIGDPVAVALRACESLDEVYEAGAEALGETVATLKGKYGHLNPGQQRMNIGNRMRAKWKKEQRS